MRLGAPLFDPFASPEEWVALLKQKGYSAAYCPVHLGDSAQKIEEYRLAAIEHDIVIPEVGAWSNNPLHPDPAVREQSIQNSIQQLRLADQVGAHCCVNIAGSFGEIWDSPHPDNVSQRAFDMTVAAVQRILDTAQPRHACYTLEMMPWTIPDSAESYLDLIRAIDRPNFVVHFDPVNIINSARRYYSNADVIRHCFDLLGPYIKGVHGKDISLRYQLTLCLEEVVPGTGGLRYDVLLSCMEQTDPDMPLLLEHMPLAEQYEQGAAFVRTVAEQLGIAIK